MRAFQRRQQAVSLVRRHASTWSWRRVPRPTPAPFSPFAKAAWLSAAGISVLGIVGVTILRQAETANGDSPGSDEHQVHHDGTPAPGFISTLLSTGSKESLLDKSLRDVSLSEAARKDNLTFVDSGLSFLRSSLPIDTITSVTASWTWPASLTALQSRVSALMLEYSLGPGSLYDEVVNAPPDLAVNPECEWDATVRLGDELCLPERGYLRQRKRRMKRDFAKLMGVRERDVNEEDIPIVAIACSGGGYRAMCNTAGSLLGAQKLGLLDVTTYMTGISGSCWAIGVLYSGVVGDNPPISDLISHLQDRISTSYLDMSTLDLLTTPPTNKYLLSGLMRKASAPGAEVSLVDIYGTLLCARLFVPSSATAAVDPRFLSLHRFRRVLDSAASMPLPILTAVMHDIPPAAQQPLKAVKQERAVSVDAEMADRLGRVEDELESVTSWLWFEWTPYEVGCDQLGAWIPSWSLGRRFDRGKNLERRPELSLTILSGIVSSAFCATLQDYFKEVQPLLRTLPGALYEWLSDVVSERRTDMIHTHAVMPNELPNFVRHLDGIREGSPEGITERETLGLMDAGALINVPYYPLLRRNVDCIIALDASVDSQDLHFQRTEEYALRRGLKTWPKGASWPTAVMDASADGTEMVPKGTPEGASSAEEAAGRRLAEAQESDLAGQAASQGASDVRNMPDGPSKAPPGTDSRATQTAGVPHVDRDPDARDTTRVPPSITGCTIWIGSTGEDETSSRVEDLDEQHLATKDGIGVVYIPQLANDAVPDFNPFSVSTFRFELTREESDKLFRLGEANFADGSEKITKLLRIMWLRKRKARLRRLIEHSTRHLHHAAHAWD